MAKRISILGSTGSIGRNTLNVIDSLQGAIEVIYITARKNVDLLVQQALKYRPSAVGIIDKEAAKIVENRLAGEQISVLAGRSGLLDIAARDDVDIMFNGLVGSSGMEPTLSALHAGVDVALSNKESLVMAGDLINREKLKTGTTLFPVDSEHSAIWQCLVGEKLDDVRRIILTGSGGPFRARDVNTFSDVTVEEALNHPNWDMGNKITIDSATMMNKGLEVIEAHWLFGLEPNLIDIVVHPQSIIHSMVEFVDGSVKAQLGVPDMKIPIQYALTYPDHYPADWEALDLPAVGELTFEKPNLEKFPCIRLAYSALEKGGTCPVVLNVANDEVVAAFLNDHIPFTQIPQLIEEALDQHEWLENPDLDTISAISQWTTNYIHDQIAAIS